MNSVLVVSLFLSKYFLIHKVNTILEKEFKAKSYPYDLDSALSMMEVWRSKY